ncbi:DsbA family protein [Hyphomicrobium sp.]|uniref:DsbA family protein n=1 Tax=Hyphomicrobium sp. TaxID=82 RepID=UPI000FB97A5C|nr:DsbA family protein [Hyphomicrobium sp.]MBN9248525.1 DsbA family protein [Hyphomicrobium sp.]RUP09799.1 MAG: DsbA family protein [Hyphomicrobium sp.]
MTLKTKFDNSTKLASISKRFAAALLGLALLASLAGVHFGPGSVRAEPVAPTAGGSAFTDEQKKALGEIIKDYLVKNPEIMFEVQNALDEKTQKEQDAKLKAFMAENAKSIYRSPGSAVAGNPDGDITVVEFFDFNCGYCKHGLPEVQKLIQDDKNVRVVFKELPILSKGSEEAAKVALAAKRQGKYWEFHQALLGSKGQANEASALKVAESLGLDMAKIKTDMASDDVKNELLAEMKLAKTMGVNGTPHFLVGNKSIPGAPDDLHEQLETLVTEFRKDKCSTC